MNYLIPKPQSVQPAPGGFSLTAAAGIYVQSGNEEIAAIGRYLAEKLKPATGFNLAVIPAAGAPGAGNIYITLEGGDPALGEEGYTLAVTPDLIALVAYMPAGLFRGIQTLRQLLPAPIEQPTVQPGPWVVPAGVIRDQPRFTWRGAMLDVARHFFGVEDVKAYIDEMAYYKLNRFHLHLSDDQGWRIEIKSWPLLTAIGGATSVGGDPGGFYTQEQYSEIVAYAQSRYITVIPEIDMPGHTNAALASYAELNCDGVARPPHTGIEVGFSTLCVGSGHHLQIHRRRDPRVGGDHAGPVPAHRRGRGPDAQPRRVQLLRAEGAIDRQQIRQADDRLGRDRPDRPAAADDRPILERPAGGRGGAQGRQADHVPVLANLPGSKIHSRPPSWD